MDGQNKGLIQLGGKTLIEHVINRLGPEIKDLVISANKDIARYQTLGYPVIEDKLPGQLGPLCGIYSAMQYLEKEWCLVVPCDVPLLPNDFIERMLNHDDSTKTYVAFDGARQHNSCCLLHCSLRGDILAHLEQNKLSLHRFLSEHQVQQVDFADEAEGFMNINTCQQLEDLKLDV